VAKDDPMNVLDRNPIPGIMPDLEPFNVEVITRCDDCVGQFLAPVEDGPRRDRRRAGRDRRRAGWDRRRAGWSSHSSPQSNIVEIDGNLLVIESWLDLHSVARPRPVDSALNGFPRLYDNYLAGPGRFAAYMRTRVEFGRQRSAGVAQTWNHWKARRHTGWELRHL